jgi:hypothetical protein
MHTVPHGAGIAEGSGRGQWPWVLSSSSCSCLSQVALLLSRVDSLHFLTPFCGGRREAICRLATPVLQTPRARQLHAASRIGSVRGRLFRLEPWAHPAQALAVSSAPNHSPCWSSRPLDKLARSFLLPNIDLLPFPQHLKTTLCCSHLDTYCTPE